jgi:hypothetical protein
MARPWWAYDLGHDDACVGVVGVSLWWCDPQFSLAVQKQTSVMEQPFRDRIYADIAKAGLK